MTVLVPVDAVETCKMVNYGGLGWTGIFELTAMTCCDHGLDSDLKLATQVVRDEVM